MPPRAPKKPPETRAELTQAVMEQKTRLDWNTDEFIARLLTFFTNVDLKMILEELRHTQGRKRT